MNGSSSNSRCSSSSFALTLRLIALRCLNERSSWISRSFSPLTMESTSPTHPAHIEVFVLLKLCEEIDQFADESERPRHELAGVVEGDHFAVGIELRQKET